MEPFFPSANGTASVVLPVFQTGYTIDYQINYFQCNFTVEGSKNPTYTGDEFNADWMAYANPIFHPLVYSSMATCPDSWRWRINSGRLYTANPRMPDYSPLKKPSVQMNGCPIHLMTDTHTKRGQGRIHYQWIDAADLDGDHFRPSFEVRIAPLIAFYTTPWSVGGWTFRPSVWSRLDNAMRPITRVKVGKRPFWFVKRRQYYTYRGYQLFVGTNF